MVHGISLLMLSAVAGYWVLTLAAKEKGRVKTLGNALGFLIIVISVLAFACKVKTCSYGMRGGACPFVGKMMAPVSDSK